ncbi:MAG: 2-C-methyl-D-erythritol 2,4-cyclodiphosphate synthase [Actinomycetota bacterium]|nr:2-C-methyl-D-erythritol 2,4-cyclodiphosphate synthase [Actinomycetota bacterium]
MSEAVSVPRVGLGFDVHPRQTGRVLMLGGVLFEGEDGLRGQSDGDAVCHAVADAMLGAGGLGDIGVHFPDTDPAFAGMAGPDLLSRVVGLLHEAGLTTTSVDLTVICERPPIDPRRQEMREALAGTLGLAEALVSVKATRPEGLGLSGDGIGCMAVAVVR